MSHIYLCYFKRACHFCFNGPLFPSPNRDIIRSNKALFGGRKNGRVNNMNPFATP